MLPDLGYFSLAERSRLTENPVVDADLSDVVQQRRPAERLALRSGQIHGISQFHAHRCHPRGVTEGRWISSVQGSGKRLHAGEITLLEGARFSLQARGHVIECTRQTTDLISSPHHGSMGQVAGGDRAGGGNQLLDWPAD